MSMYPGWPSTASTANGGEEVAYWGQTQSLNSGSTATSTASGLKQATYDSILYGQNYMANMKNMLNATQWENMNPFAYNPLQASTASFPDSRTVQLASQPVFPWMKMSG
ncbi:hypothetical protein WR25_06163 [Diploscapter pachys]|uniref:Uncharacterized protein n=1 Tax=Diploscapter pachys TaxID=2018661 RepID=A0A2A2JB97_9BILA|nr:hypothetical protein WR25_12828 [Diploscapter pachys]PAV89502.1 hypothetical protein WR25_06163 [Diploscapter pachys]